MSKLTNAFLLAWLNFEGTFVLTTNDKDYAGAFEVIDNSLILFSKSCF